MFSRPTRARHIIFRSFEKGIARIVPWRDMWVRDSGNIVWQLRKVELKKFSHFIAPKYRSQRWIFLSSTQRSIFKYFVIKPRPNASRRKFAKPELAHGLAKSRKFHAYTVDLRSICVDSRWAAKRWKTCVDLRTNLSSTKVNASHSKWVAKRNASRTQVENLCWLASTCESVWPGLYVSCSVVKVLFFFFCFR